MNATFASLVAQLEEARPLIPQACCVIVNFALLICDQNSNVTFLFDEIVDSLTMVSLRASSVLGMYDFSASWSPVDVQFCSL
jgi:hypothetical protein